MLLVARNKYATWERCCLFYRKSTQDGKGVACFTGRVRKTGKVLPVLQEEYAKRERCCLFYRKSTQRGKGVACFTGRVCNVGKMLPVYR
ncbi:hypothetical protein COK84_26405 [Bacillus thuringiensis]|nr:hypothetical protein CN426_24695 [Bacillus thuringiensis]PFT06234.1 hypothetical protein COK84_26405 [Bacillus thuringiensis]